MRSAVKCMLLALVLWGAAGCNTKNVEFHPFDSAEGRFKAMTPAPMLHTAKLTHWATGDVMLHSYALEHDDVIYVVNYFDVPEEISDGLRKQMLFNSPFPGRDDLIKAQHWTVKQLRPASSGPGPDKQNERFHEWFTATSANGKQAVDVKLLWYKNRFYQIMVAHHVVPSYFQMLNAEKFVRSVEIR
jgi:hypothetical protein